MMASKSSTVTSIISFGRLVPALLIRMLNGCGFRDRGLHGGQISHVEHQRVGLLPARADRACGFLDLGRGAREQGHMRAAVRQRGGRREPDAASGAGHQRALAVEAEGGGGVEMDRHARCSTLPWRGRVGGEAAGVG